MTNPGNPRDGWKERAPELVRKLAGTLLLLLITFIALEFGRFDNLPLWSSIPAAFFLIVAAALSFVWSDELFHVPWSRRIWAIPVMFLIALLLGVLGKWLPTEAGLEVTEKVPVGGQPTAIATGAGAVWVANADGTISRIDFVESQITKTIAVGSQPVALSVGYGAVWVANVTGELVRIDFETLEVTDKIPVGLEGIGEDIEWWIFGRPINAANSVAIGADSVWVPSFTNRTVWRIDVESREVAGWVNVGRAPFDATFSLGALWVANRDDGTVSVVDPETMEVIDTIHVGIEPTELEVSPTDGSVWVANKGSNTVSRIDPNRREVTDTIPVGTGPVGIAIGAGSVWVTNVGDHTVSRIDVVTRSVTDTIDVGFVPGGIAVGGEAVWIVDYGDGTVSRISLDAGELARD